MLKSGRWGSQKGKKTVLYKSFLEVKGRWENHIKIGLSKNDCEAQGRVQQR
jgi:hypothetical protein